MVINSGVDRATLAGHYQNKAYFDQNREDQTIFGYFYESHL
jgi:hypothetical protein